MIRERIWIAVLVLLPLSATRGNGQALSLHDGDRVVLYGDSITAQRLYSRFVEDFVLTRYPQMHVTFWNAGIPGDTVYGGYTGDVTERLKRDVFPHQPTVITVMLGMNDGYYMAFNQKYLDIYKEGYRKLLSAIQTGAPTVKITLITPTPYDEVSHGTEFAHYNEVVSRHSAFVKELAGSSRLGFSDFNQVETDLLNEGIRKNGSLAALLVPDRIHPAEASHWAMATALVRSWGLSPVVSSVKIDAATASTVTIENTHVTDLTEAGGKLRWSQTDKALPLPLSLDDGMIQFVLNVSDLAIMDRQMLSVIGLSEAQYILKIDEKKIASFSREELSSGVNLALYSTPMESQAKGVDGLEQKRAALDEARFILSIEDPKVANAADYTNAMEAKDSMLREEQRKIAQPKLHRFELSPE